VIADLDDDFKANIVSLVPDAALRARLEAQVRGLFRTHISCCDAVAPTPYLEGRRAQFWLKKGAKQ
jgi:hypothetical protein